MDDFLEQMFPFASWSEMGSVSRAPWDYNSGGSANAMSMEIDSSLPVPQRLSLLPPVRVGGSTESQASSFQTRQVHNNISHPQADGAVHYASEESSITSRLQQLQILRTAALDSGASSSVGHPHINGKSPGAQEAVHSPVQNTSEGVATTGSVAPQVNAGKSLLANALPSQMVAAGTGSYRALGMTRSPSVGNEGFGSQQSPPDSQLSSTVAPTWRQSFGGVSPLPVVGGQVKAEFPAEATSNDAHLLGKMSRDDDEARHGPQESFFNNFPGELGRLQPRTAGQQSHQQMQVGQGAPIQQYACHTGHAQPQGAAAVIAGTRTRVRARRGQATDPHSIAERLRRERIAERMKALQELVPNANKTDKASMLDEVIEYVKFLQLQVKVLSMSRLGGAGAVAPLVTDLLAEGHNIFGATALGHGAGVSCPPQNGSAVTEHQVAQLLEKDMGSAMQFLQSKGLCLMPISLATVISTTNHRTPTGILSGLQGLTAADRPQDVLSSTTAASSISTEVSGAIVSPANVEGNGVSHAAATED